jgi:hypothetical protein
MALNSANVDVAITGAVSFGPTATTAPTTAISALAAGFRDVGYISDDGVSEVIDKSTNNIVAWQGSAVVRTVVTESSISLTFTMIETNANSVELFYAAPVSAVDGSVAIVPAATGGRRSFVLDYVDGAKMVRLYIPQGEVTEVGEVTLASGDPVGYNVTITGYPDVTLGASAKKWYSALDTTP